MQSNDDNNACSPFNPRSISTPILPTRPYSKDPDKPNNDHTLFNPTTTPTTNRLTHTKPKDPTGTEGSPPTLDKPDETNNDLTLFNPTTNQPTHTKLKDSTGTEDSPPTKDNNKANNDHDLSNPTTTPTYNQPSQT